MVLTGSESPVRHDLTSRHEAIHVSMEPGAMRFFEQAAVRL